MENKINLCKQCAHCKFNAEVGVICGLTNAKPGFEHNCPLFEPAQQPQSPTPSQKCHNTNYLATNKSAEKIVNIVATIYLILGILLVLIYCFAGLYQWAEYDRSGSYLFTTIVMTVIYIGGILFFWAMMKVFINISNNLFNLNQRVDNIDQKLNR